MRKGVRLLLIIIICAFLCGCNETKITDNHIFKMETENDRDYVLECIHMDREYIDNIICIQDGNVFYSSYEEQDTILAFYRYHIDENITYKIGEIENPYIDSGDFVAVDDCIFFYCNVIISDLSNSGAKVENALYQMDITENTLQKIASDFVDQTLVYISAADDNIISFKGKLNGSESITYLDIVDVSKKENVNFDTIIFKVYDREQKSGEIIYNFSVYDAIIYVMVGTRNSTNDTLWTIEEYDCNGNYIDSVDLNNEITDLINGERISKFEIFKEYGFIRTFSGSGILFHLSSDKISPILSSETDLDIAIPSNNAVNKYVVIYSRDTGDIWRLDIEDSSLYKLDLSYEYLKYVCLSQDDKVLVSSDDIIYGEIALFPSEDENLLTY